MSRCGPVVAIIDSDSLIPGVDPLLQVRGGCVVHTHYAPCPRDGEPACPDVMHGDEHPSAEASIRSHRVRTLGQRPLLLHRGSLTDVGPAGQDHAVGATDTACWCGGTYYPPREVT